MQEGARHIASGRHGSIYAVLPTRECGWVAVKVVHGPVGGRTNGSKPHDISQEARILSNLQRLDQCNIVSLLKYEYHADPHEHHIHLPFLPISLSNLLYGQLHFDLIQSIIFQSLLAIAHLHDQGVAHRDINPNNIMIDWDGTVKIIDFGLAWTGGDVGEEDGRAWHETKDQMICDVGTGRWRAPELLFSPSTYDAFALDLWSIGAVITEMFVYVPVPDSDDEDKDEEEDPLEDDGPIRSPARNTLFDDGFGDIGLAGSIFRALGTPTKQSWPEFDSLPDAGKIDFITCPPLPLSDILPTMPLNLVDLTTSLLSLSPSRRKQASQALAHPFLDAILVPKKNDVWYGEPRVDLSARCVEEKGGKRLVDHLAEELRDKRKSWAPLAQAR